MELASPEITPARQALAKAKRIVVKVGSNLVATPEGVINRDLLQSIVTEMAELSAQQHEVLLVTSGAVRIGLAKMGLAHKAMVDLSTRQAAAAVGQVELISCYNQLFGEQGCTIGQLLLTGDDLTDRRRYLHIRNTLLPMLCQYRVVPVINENDSVSIAGVQIGENDRLAALIAGKVQCDLLIILSDVAGFYTGNPALDKEAKLLPLVKEITPELMEMAGGSTSGVGKGGMRSKITAAKIATRFGASMVIALGREPQIISQILAGKEIGTLFPACNGAQVKARKQWFGFAATTRGTLVVDDGAATALIKRGSSLLPIGIREVTGMFNAGAAVSVLNQQGEEIARGLANYSADEMKKIAGEKTAEIEKILGYHPYDEAIHRDNILLV